MTRLWTIWKESDKGGWKSSSTSEFTIEKAFFSYNHTDQPRSVKAYIVQTSPPPSFYSGEVSLDYLPRRGEGDLKNFKKGWKYGAGAGLLKRGGGWHLSYLIFSRFIIFTFWNYFILCKIVVCKKNYFFLSNSLMKKGHSKLSKNEPENISYIN